MRLMLQKPPVVFVDTETTGLHPDNHEIWEVALVYPCEFSVSTVDTGTHDGWVWAEKIWQFSINEPTADPMGLAIGKYWERRWTATNDRQEFCREFQQLTHGQHLVGAVPSFDEERLRRMMHAHGVLHTWHYHLIDVEALAMGFLAGRRNALFASPAEFQPPWKSHTLSEACGVVTDPIHEHTALYDALWAMKLYEAILTPDYNEIEVG